MLVIPREQLSLMLPTQIYKAAEDDARIKIYFENWGQPGVLRRSQPTPPVSAEEWAHTIKLDAAPVMRQVVIGSVQSDSTLIIRNGGSRICIYGVRFSTHHYLEIHN